VAITINRIGDFRGKPVQEAVLESTTGARVAVMNWGLVVRDWQVPAGGSLRSVALGFDSFAPYPEHSPYFGAVVGRVANRIRNARFALGGKTYDLPANEGPNQLHGGPDGLGRQVWDMEADSEGNALKFTYQSPDGEMGFPGNVRFEVLYTLTGNRLRMDLYGLPDEPTPISMVQHHYFNLGTTDTVLDHMVHLPEAVAYTVPGPDLIQSGVITPSAGTINDFLTPRTMRYGTGRGIDYDLNFVLATGRDTMKPIALATGEDGALTLRLFSDRPGLQFYNGVSTNVPVPGLGGRRYGKNSGLCFEDQKFPDAVNNPHFPTVICAPDNPYRHWCEFEIA
jgi:aldose 1-epimerase